MSIPQDLLERIQAKGIEEEDYKRAEQYVKSIETVSPLFFQTFLIIDYYKMRVHFVEPKIHMTQYKNKHDCIDDYQNDINRYITGNVETNLLLATANMQDFIRNQPPCERKDFIFSSSFPIQDYEEKITLNYRCRTLETAPDGKSWLCLGILDLSPCKDDNLLMALNTKKQEIYTYDSKGERWDKTTSPMLSDKEKNILYLAAQGFLNKEIADILSRTDSTIESHRKKIFKKLNAENMMEAVGYAMNLQLL